MSDSRINNVTIQGTDIVTTSLGFGCGRLMRTTSRRARLALLSEAFDGGISHFDVARMYGLGKVESEVGSFLRGRRDRVVIATKFGIEVKPVAGPMVVLQSLARLLLKTVPALRKVAVSHSSRLYVPKDFGAAAARRSLEASLKALGTDYIDLLLLHEPTLADVRGGEVCEFLDKAKQTGQIRGWGVAGYPDDLLPVCAALPKLASLIQLPNDAINRQIGSFEQYADSTLITFSPFSSALGVIQKYMSDHSEACSRWSDSLGMDMSKPGNIAGLLLGYCLQANANGIVLFSSNQRGGIADGVKVWKNRFSQQVIQTFLALVDEEMGLQNKGIE